MAKTLMMFLAKQNHKLENLTALSTGHNKKRSVGSYFCKKCPAKKINTFYKKMCKKSQCYFLKKTFFLHHKGHNLVLTPQRHSNVSLHKVQPVSVVTA